jgi:DNA helicase HerA-like ATPase
MSDTSNTVLIGGAGGAQVRLNLGMANRHGLIAGATGTGKTITLQVLTEQFSRAGVPVLLSDVKGDLSGIAAAGKPHPKVDERVASIGIADYRQEAAPTLFWDLYAEQGHPLRTTVSEFGPLLFAACLDLNDVQAGALYTLFKIADDAGLLLLDLKDLQAMLNWMKEEGAAQAAQYGGVSSASLSAIQRRLLMLQEQGGDVFFGEPALNLDDLMRTDLSGRGLVSVLDATRLIRDPRLYGLFLLWLISELFEELPEVGDADKPKLVFFFDEAHLLFDNAPKALLDKVEQVVRLIRSKGVGIYFVTQSPADVPEDVLGQLGNRVQHALRAFTPKDQKAVKVAAQTFRPNPAFDTATAITELGVGEALVSVLDPKGSPTPVERVLIAPPGSRIGPITAEERRAVMERSPLKGKYDAVVDRESAAEMLAKRAAQRVQQKEKELDISVPKPQGKSGNGTAERRAPAPRASQRQSSTEAFVKSTLRSVGSSLGRQIVRGLLGSILKK